MSKRSELPRASIEDMRRAGPHDQSNQTLIEFYFLVERSRTITRTMLPDGTHRLSVCGYIGEGRTWTQAMQDLRETCEADGINFG